MTTSTVDLVMSISSAEMAMVVTEDPLFWITLKQGSTLLVTRHKRENINSPVSNGTQTNEAQYA